MGNRKSEAESERETKEGGSGEQASAETDAQSLTSRDQKIVVGVCLFLLLWAGWRWVDLSRWGEAEIEVHRLSAMKSSYLIDINEANWLEYAMLDGVGEVLAKRIVLYREKHGPFSAVEDLRNVKGIGKKTFKKIEPHLVMRKSPDRTKSQNR